MWSTMIGKWPLKTTTKIYIDYPPYQFLKYRNGKIKSMLGFLPIF